MENIADFELCAQTIQIYLLDKIGRSCIVRIFPDKEVYKQVKVWILDKRDSMRRSFIVPHFDAEFDLCMKIAEDLEQTWGKDEYWRKYVPAPTTVGQELIHALTTKAKAKGYACEIVQKDSMTILTLNNKQYLCRDLLDADRIIERRKRI